MKHNLKFLVLLLMLLAIVLAGCCGGGSKETKVVTESTKTTTTGQELQDLKKANDEGALSQEEYETAKEKVLKGE